MTALRGSLHAGGGAATQLLKHGVKSARFRAEGCSAVLSRATIDVFFNYTCEYSRLLKKGRLNRLVIIFTFANILDVLHIGTVFAALQVFSILGGEAPNRRRTKPQTVR